MATLLPRVDPLTGRPGFDASTPDAADGAPDPSLVRDHDFGRSLMDRAQRRLHAQDELEVNRRVHLQRAATSSFALQAQLAEVNRQGQQLADAERLQFGRRQLGQAFDADALAQSLQTIRDTADPIEQRVRLTQLRSRYAPFAADPHLAQRIDTQIDALEPVVQRNEEAALLQSILAGRYAPTLAEARTAFPGRKINTFAHPATGATFFVPDKIAADPDLEAEAVQVVLNASSYAGLTGNRAHLDTVLQDEAYRRVSRIPGNRASAVFERELLSIAPPAGSPPSAPAAAASGYFLGEDYRVHRPQTGVVAGPRDEAARLANGDGATVPGDDPAAPSGVDGSPDRGAADYTHLRYPLVRNSRKRYPETPFNPHYDVDPLANFPLEAKSTWNYSRNERIINVPRGMSVDEALGLIRKDFETFQKFSVEKNNIAEVVVDKSAGRAFFTLEPLRTLGSGFGAGNDSAVGVALKKSGDTQAAITLGNHQLRGIRTWEAEDLKDGRISIRTEAFEIPRLGLGSSSIFNAVGTKFRRGDQAAVWDTYFKNIDEAYFGGAGEVIPFHHKRSPETIENPFAGYFKQLKHTPASPDQKASSGSLSRLVQTARMTGAGAPLSRRDGGAAESVKSPSEPGEAATEKRVPESAAVEASTADTPDETSAFALGVEWLKGKGPRHRIFREGDKMTTQIQRSPEVANARREMTRRLAQGDFSELSFGRNAGAEAKSDYAAGFVDDLFNNPARAFLGSYGAKAEVMEVGDDNAVVRYTITNSSGLESASRLPHFGYKTRSDGTRRPSYLEMYAGLAPAPRTLSDMIPSSILPDNAFDWFGPGPGSTKSQAIIWFETLPIKIKPR